MKCHPHVFVVPGDVTRLAADAWILPTDRTIDVGSGWLESVEGLQVALDGLGDRAAAFRAGTAHALVLPDWPKTSPEPVLVAVPYHGVHDVRSVIEPLDAGLRLAAAEAQSRVSLRCDTAQRGLPLVAMPLFGSAGGGGDWSKGELIRTVLDVAAAVAAATEVDVVLVLRKESALAQAHAMRRADPCAWQDLDPHLVDRARTLAEYARNGRLVPFIGAGVSATAGVPLWKDLVHELAKGHSECDRQDFEDLDTLDQGNVVRGLFDDRDTFTKEVARLTNVERYGLAPVLLAGLPTREAVTLNYDDLYEKAADAMGRRLAVLPQEAVGEDGRWLLKLHGTVDDPASIVLTREDYLEYGRGRDALSALAKAMLLTRHLLFVGFGLEDDHFQGLMYDVRNVLPPNLRHHRRLGTALMLSPKPMMERMWGKDLDLVPVGGSDVPHQARRLEIFLDCLLAHADQGLSFFLDDRYLPRLTDSERKLRERLLAVVHETSPAERNTPAWGLVADLLRSLGLEQPRHGASPVTPTAARPAPVSG